MMHEEFEKLTGLTVSYNYYTKNIEPEYAQSNIEKAEFCASWLKTHKADVCKALASDISGMTREDAVVSAIKADYDRLVQVAGKHRQEEEGMEVDIHNLKFEINSQNENIEALEAENKRLEGAVKHYSSAADELYDLKVQREKALADKDAEIMKLKAMLFDMMYKTA